MTYVIVAVLVVLVAALAYLGNRRRRGNSDVTQLHADQRGLRGQERTLRQQSRGRG